MMPLLPDLLLPLYYGTLLLLAAFGCHRALLLVLYLRYRRRLETPPDPQTLPVVTVQLPLYNEMYVATRLLDAVCELDYPRDRLEIQVLDDSDDETCELLQLAVEKWRARGVDVRRLHRTKRIGFKAGALASGLESARGELIAVFDADFVPGTTFLRKTVPWFQDEGVGMVQARWDHLNRGFSLLTRIQAVLLDGHFRIEHAARFASGRFFNFNGTAGVWRRRAIETAGGWQHDTLTEDLDLSYRAQLHGWRFLYLAELGVPAELPVDIAGFKSQQYRWAKGSVQTARKLLGRILRARVPRKKKIEAFFHLTTNFAYPLMVLLSVLIFPAVLARQGNSEWMLLVIDLPLFLAATLSVVAYYSLSQLVFDDREEKLLRILPAVLALGIGLSVNNSRAVLSGLIRNGGTFVRTPKYRIVGPDASWRNKKYRAEVDGTFVLEGLLSLYLVVCLGLAIYQAMWLAVPFLYLFVQGYGYVFLQSVSAWARSRRGRYQALRPLALGAADGTALPSDDSDR